MKILITGCAGFGGLNFTKYFLDKGHEIVGFYTPETADYLGMTKKFYSENGQKIISGDIRKKQDLMEAMKDVDVVINEEAIIEAPISAERPLFVHDINVNGFLNVLECAREVGCRVVCVSSNIPYGQALYKPIDEKHPQIPNSPYGASRACQEKYAISYHRTFGIPVVILRYSNLYGPYGKGVINVFVDKARGGEKITVTGGGTQTRTFTWITDAARGTELALNSKKALGQIYNIAGPETSNLLGLIEIIKEKFPNLEVRKTEHWKGDITSTDYSISIEKARKELGYKPKYKIKDGIEDLMGE